MNARLMRETSCREHKPNIGKTKKAKLWEELVALTVKKATKPNEKATGSNVESKMAGELCQNTNIQILLISHFLFFFITCVFIGKIEFKLLIIIVCTKVRVQLHVE